MHRYYVHAFANLLQHKSGYELYQVRHPFPPYATHYLLLLGLSQFLSFDLAEKLFACLTMTLFGVGLRLTAKAVGAAGEWTALFTAPLLLSWAMMMGFFNYVLGVSLVLLATAFWQRSGNKHRWSVLGYLLVVAVLAFTHPVPLLLLVFIMAMDLTLGGLFRSTALSWASWAHQETLRIAAFVFTVLAMGFPALALDRSAANTAKTIADTHFKMNYVRTALLLTGISPYNTRSRDLWINAYRLCLVAILFGAFWLAGKACVRALKARRPNLGTTLFVAIPILVVALPILPNEVNGSYFFSTRLIMVLWPAALIAAAVSEAPTRKQQRRLLVSALLSTLLTLIPAQKFFRPVANDLKAAESVPLPDGRTGTILLGDKLVDYARYGRQLAFNPYQWGTLLPVVAHNDVVLDAPWMEQRIAPLAPAPGSPLLLDDVSVTYRSQSNPPLVRGRSLPATAEADLIQRSSFLVFAGAPGEIAQGLSTQLSLDEAARFSCTRAQAWYLVCLRK